MSSTADQLASALTAYTRATNQAKAATANLADISAFANAAHHAGQARHWRRAKAKPANGLTPGQCEAKAREHEARVREIALQSEIELARRADLAEVTA